jgi:zinc protease
MKGAMLVLVLAAACGAVAKPPDPDRRLRVMTDGSMFESDRGYLFAVLPDTSSKVVRLDVRYPVGSMDDPPGKEGLAHLVEHMLFDLEIMRDGKKTSVSAELGRVALSWNAETDEDFTDYQVVASPEALPELMSIEVDRMTVGCGGLTPAIVAREREVVLNELRERQGASGAALRQAINNAVFPEGHPYRPVDSVESVEKLEFKDVCDFLATRYHSGTARMIASGNVSVTGLQGAVQTAFGRLRPRKQETRRTPPPVEPRHGIMHIKADVDVPMLVATWPLPPEATRDYRMLDLLTNRVAGELEDFAFMFKWGHSAEAFKLGGTAAPVLGISISLSSVDKADDAVDATDSAVRAALTSLGSEKDSAGWVFTWEARAASLLARWEGLASRNRLMDELLDEPERTLLASRIEELHATDPGTVRGIAEKWLAKSRALYIVVEPIKSGAYHPHRTYKGDGAEAHGTAVDPTAADRPLPVPPASARLDIERYTLDNGLTVVMWDHGALPLVHGSLIVHAGSAHDPMGKEGVARLVGASEVDSDDLIFDESSLSIRVDNLVRGLGWELREPGYELGDEQKAYLKARLQAQHTAERVHYERDLLAAAYGAGHPYARVSMTAESVDQLHRDLVMDWARGHIVPANSVLILAGQFDHELMKKHIAYNVGHVSSGHRTEPVGPAPDRNAPAWIEGKQAAGSPTLELDILFPSGPGLGRNYASRLVLQHILESRLQELREKQALTYGFSVDYEPRLAGGLWRISGEVDASRADEAAKAVVGILDQMRRDPESYRSAFVLARQKALESIVVSGTGTPGVTARLVLTARFDLPDAFFDSVAQSIASLTLANIAPFVASELAVDKQVFGAFGNPDAVAAALAAAKAVH